MAGDHRGEPADEHYAAMADAQRSKVGLAGDFLVLAVLYEDPAKAIAARALAEEYAVAAADLSRQMKAWRLANGWPS